MIMNEVEMVKVLCKRRSAHVSRRERNRAKALLDKLKREQAIALRTGQYPAASCPICFEDFNPAPARPVLTYLSIYAFIYSLIHLFTYLLCYVFIIQGGDEDDATPSAPPLPTAKLGVQV